MEYVIRQEDMERFQRKMLEEEKSSATMEKYMRDIRAFRSFIGERGSVSKERVIAYKAELMKRYAPASANSMLTAVNGFLKRMGWHECVVKTAKLQPETFRAVNRELSQKEYFALLEVARRQGKDRLLCLMETLCATGIRVSELPFVTVEAVRMGRARVSLKGKTRTVLLPNALRRELFEYARKKGIRRGSLFVTSSGRPLDRTNILHEMKALARKAGVDEGKVFPHNLRHLFACTYYKKEKDLCRLADLLGHTNVNTTRMYTRISYKEQLRQIEQLELVLCGHFSGYTIENNSPIWAYE